MSNPATFDSIAIKLGLIPLVSGVLCLLLWLQTRLDGLMSLGIFIVLIGGAMVTLGGIGLAFFHFRDAPGLGLSKRETRKRTLVASLVLLANFPAAALCMATAIHYSSQFIVVVENESDHAIVAAEILGGGVRGFHGPLGQPGTPADPDNYREAGTVLPTIASGESRTFVLYFEHEGTLRFDVDGPGEAKALVVEGYVMRGHGGKRTVTILADGSAQL